MSAVLTTQRFIDQNPTLIAILKVVTGALAIAASVACVVYAFNFQSIHETEHRTLKAACERSKVFGPPLLDHLERVENRLHLNALDRQIEWPIGSGHHEQAIEFYRQTIPKECP